jgi:hypothetical protein
MTGFEDRVRSGLGEAAEAYEPSPRLRVEVDRRVKRHRRGRIVTGVVGTVGALIFVAGLGVLLATDDQGNQNESTAATTLPGGWRDVEVLGLTMEVPEAWWQQSFDPACDGRPAHLVGNVESVVLRGRVEHARPDGSQDCMEAWVMGDLPDDHVVIRLSPADGGPYSGVVDQFPLDGERVLRTADQLAPLAVLVDGREVASISLWVGPDATDADLAVAYRIIESIRPA